MLSAPCSGKLGAAHQDEEEGRNPRGKAETGIALEQTAAPERCELKRWCLVRLISKTRTNAWEVKKTLGSYSNHMVKNVRY